MARFWQMNLHSHMCIVMFMPSKNVYVSEADLPLFESAAAQAGGLSAAVVAGLRLYLAQQERRRKGGEMTQIELEVDEGLVAVTKRFTGRKLLVWRHDEGHRTRSCRVFRTAKGQFAVYERDDPDWVALSRSDDAASWDDPGSWRDGWWDRGQRTLTVFATADDMAGVLPDELVAAIKRAEDQPEVEDLDI